MKYKETSAYHGMVTIKHIARLEDGGPFECRLTMPYLSFHK